MQRNVRTLLIISAAVLILGSCSVYHPQLSHVPLLKEQGEMVVQPSLAINSDFGLDMEVSAAYAPVNHLGVLVHGSFENINNTSAEAAVGYFTNIGEGHGVMELYGGVSYGNSLSESKNSQKGITDRYGGYYRSWFGQFNLGFRSLGCIDLGFGFKGGYLYPTFYHNDVSRGEVTHYNSSPRAFVEPLFLFRVGGESIKFTLEAGYINIDNSQLSNEVSFNYSTFTFGAGFTLFLK